MKKTFLMRMLIAVGLCMVMLCAGCRSYNEAKQNRENMEKLRIGMTREQVKSIMGEPLNESYCTPDVWFYYTQHKWYDGVYTRDECTPLLFDSVGKLQGVGYDAYKRILEKDVHRRYLLDEQL